MKLPGFLLCIAAAHLVGACASPGRVRPYVTAACPLPSGVHGYPVVAHDPAGKLDAATLTRAARAVASHLETWNHQSRDSLPDDLATLSARLEGDHPFARGDWSPVATDTASIVIVYHAGEPAPVVRPRNTRSETSDFARRVLRATIRARDESERHEAQSDTLPLHLSLSDRDSAVVLLRFGSEPGAADGVARLAVEEREVVPYPSNPSPAYPTIGRLAREDAEVVVAFVVDTNGAADMSTVRVLRSSDPAFTSPVLQSLARYRYVPRQIDCRTVPVVVQQPFIFHIMRR